MLWHQFQQNWSILTENMMMNFNDKMILLAPHHLSEITKVERYKTVFKHRLNRTPKVNLASFI
jgi:hypothetical protein